MDVVVDEVRGNVVAAAPAAPAESAAAAAPPPAHAERKMLEDLTRAAARQLRLRAD